MKLITKEIENKTPRFYATDGKKESERIVYAHFFNVFNNWDWYLLEYNPETKEGYGLVKGWETEYGYFNIPELEEAHTERDRNFKPELLSVIREKGKL